MEDDKRERLIALGPEVLADALQTLAVWQEKVANTVERLISTPEGNANRFRRALGRIKHREYASGVRGTRMYAIELTEILADLAAADLDPRSGVEAVADFFRADESIFEMCDDSRSNIGDVFCFDAVKLFAEYASRCSDEAWVIDVVVELNMSDDYCVRGSLFRHAADYLSESGLREFVERLWKLSGDNTWQRDSNRIIETLAGGLGDAALFERARRASRSVLSVRDCEEIAKFYHETGDSEAALSWLRRNPDVISTVAGGNTDLLLAIHRKLGNRKEMEEAAWKLFHRHRTEESLAELLEAIGEDRREEVILDETREILLTERMSYSDANFLIQMGRMDEAETYLLEHAGQINGEYFPGLEPLAEQMDHGGRSLAASIIYRSLLDSILQRAKSKYYHHGIRCLKELDKLAEGITDWKRFPSHLQYCAGLRADHGRKRSFWSRFEA